MSLPPETALQKLCSRQTWPHDSRALTTCVPRSDLSYFAIRESCNVSTRRLVVVCRRQKKKKRKTFDVSMACVETSNVELKIEHGLGACAEEHLRTESGRCYLESAPCGFCKVAEQNCSRHSFFTHLTLLLLFSSSPLFFLALLFSHPHTPSITFFYCASGEAS